MPRLDLTGVPGKRGMNALLTDMQTLAFLRRKAARGRFVTSVRTSSPRLGAAGLLRGKRAACHWSWRDNPTSSGAQALQVGMGYAPAPPFSAGSPTTAPREMSDAAHARSVTMLAKRRVQSREGREGALDGELMRAKRDFDFMRLPPIGP
jgi:cyclohexyl-isocyanide hydratase